MSDICDLILEQHHEMRRRFAELDELRAQGDAGVERLAETWQGLHQLLDAHAEAEEILFYPLLLRIAASKQADEETEDAIGDHNDIRDAAAGTEHQEAGAAEWWAAVGEAREHNSTHMAEEERGALPDARSSIEAAERQEIGARWESFMTGRLRALAEQSHDKDPQRYVETEGRGE